MFKNVKRVENMNAIAEAQEDVPQTKKEPVFKSRLTVEKRGDLRFISHLDWLRMIYRAVSRAKLPVAYSQGFNPRPKIAFSPALPLFTEAFNEYIDIELTEYTENIPARLNPYMPALGQVLNERMLPLRSPSIDSSILSQTYRANYSVSTTCAEPQKQVNMTERIAFLKSQDTLPVEVETRQKSGTRGKRKPQTAKKVLDLVPYLENLSVDGDDVISFTIRRLPVVSPTTTEGSNEVLSGSYDHDSQNLPDNAADSEENSAAFGQHNSGLVSIKPSWVLDLINPTVKWSLARTGMEMTP